MTVVKVGGSLFGHPALGPGLVRWLGDPANGPGPFLLVPGGGPAADAVREWDRVHGLGDTAAHRLAVRAMSLTAALLNRLVPGSAIVHSPRPAPGLPAVRVLDADEFCAGDETLPHSWAVTSDSIAARAAAVGGASRLVLLKSVDVPPGTDWPTAAANGWVDAYFPGVVAGAAFRTEGVNFRRWLEEQLLVL